MEKSKGKIMVLAGGCLISMFTLSMLPLAHEGFAQGTQNMESALTRAFTAFSGRAGKTALGRATAATTQDFEPLKGAKWLFLWTIEDEPYADTLSFGNATQQGTSDIYLPCSSQALSVEGLTSYSDLGYMAMFPQENLWVTYTFNLQNPQAAAAQGSVLLFDLDFNLLNDFSALTARVYPLVADFSAQPLSGEAPLAVSFTNQTHGYAASYLWDFGDGSGSTEENPVHSYDTPGTYAVSFTVTNDETSQTEGKPGFIQVTSPAVTQLLADFSAHPTSGEVPLTVNFTDQSTGNITAWLWDYGDGGTGIERNPTHVYEKAGTYTVSLTVQDPLGTDTDTRFAHILAAPRTSLPCDVNADGTVDLEDALLALKMACHEPIEKSVIIHRSASISGKGTIGLPEALYALKHMGDVMDMNQAPVAQAGQDQTVTTGSVVQLDGSASTDPDGDPLTYAWTLSSKPAGSTASLSSADTATPSLTSDLEGDYQITLVVNDGTIDSAPATLTITALSANQAPVAHAGEDQTVTTGSVVQLDGSASSDPDGDPLTYTWSITSKPAGSTAALSDPVAGNPSFTADMEGTYVLRLIVNDGDLDSVPDTIAVTAGQRDLEVGAVGNWLGAANCGGQNIEFGYILCPQGRLRGYEKFSDHPYIVCGTWSIDNEKIVLDYKWTAVEWPHPDGYDTKHLEYNPEDDSLRWTDCPFPMNRITGSDVDVEDCTKGTCSSGGTGAIECGTDCDCGRCWYCDDGTCRYGGEGPYGCYRGCGW